MCNLIPLVQKEEPRVTISVVLVELVRRGVVSAELQGCATDDSGGGGTGNTRTKDTGGGATGTGLTRADDTAAGGGTGTGRTLGVEIEACATEVDDDVGTLLCWLDGAEEVGRWRRVTTVCGWATLRLLFSSVFESVQTDGVGIPECAGLLLLAGGDWVAAGAAENWEASLFTELTLG
ncbi:hypothetical protein HPB52_006789 [Rhipicephalus sanguineus]|uniref:Uncharacterized protein n=1 Tax=Rhipicephalus sanguineus TaxID=34632 RepID=A0A9D4QHU7_RHISA|nr:hypothetical protein HPB52_006789 [Rhipicephalus sanguineus]